MFMARHTGAHEESMPPANVRAHEKSIHSTNARAYDAYAEAYACAHADSHFHGKKVSYSLTDSLSTYGQNYEGLGIF